MSKENKMIPELRFPEFENDGEWEIKSLDKVVNDFIVPMRDKPKKLDGEIPWCRIEDFDGMYLNGSKSNQGVSVETVKEMNLKVYPVNSLLVSCSADLGRCAITQKSLVTNQTFIGLVPDIGKVNTVYLYYVMSNSRNELNARSSGTTISYLSRQQFEKFEIILPKPNEQQKIASCLSSLDEVITAHSQKLELLKVHKKGLMQNLFPQEGEKVPKLRFREFENDGEWVEKKLGEVGEFLGGGTPSTASPEFWIGKIPWISSSDIKDDDIHNISITRFINEKAIQESATKIIPKGSVLFVSRVGVGKLAINKVEICTSQDFTSFVPMKEVSNFFIGYCFSSNKNLLQSLNQGTSIKGFSKSDLEKFKFLYPKNPNEQQKITSCLSSLDASIAAQAEKIEQLKLHKKGLMQGLFPVKTGHALSQ